MPVPTPTVPEPEPLATLTNPFCPPLIPPGPYLQIYRDAIRGRTPQEKRDKLARYCDRIRDLGLPGVIFHGFCRDLCRNWIGLAKLADDRQLVAMSAWGLDGSQDDDGSTLTPAEKGQCIGEVLANVSCAAGFADAEGAWDSCTGPDDGTGEQGALVMGNEIRKRAKRALLGDQPWFAIDSHGGLRQRPRPLGSGGPFAGFPVDEFSSYVDMHFPQAYANDFTREYGKARYPRVFGWMERDWRKIERVFDPLGLRRPRGVTIQGYGWRAHDLCDCLLGWWVRRQQPMPIWVEPWPDEVTIQCIRGVQKLLVEGFAGPGIAPVDAVRAWQEDANTHGAGLVVDGQLGEVGLAHMGFPIAD
jgi:hypothetical protein